MEFEEAFVFVHDMWPEKIDISDIKMHENGGASIPKLTKIHDQIEEKNLELEREVVIMDWSIYQYLHLKAREIHQKGVSILITKDIDLNELRKLYNENVT